MKIYDTKSRKKRQFNPIEEGKVSMYVCGPTVYNKIHVGNARTFISFDTIRRYLEYRGYEVKFVQNLTDVDDKIINRANEEGKSAEEIANTYSDKFISDMRGANVLDPTIRPRATQEIPEMIDIIQTLIDKGHAYEQDGDVYFDVKSDNNYGELSGRDIDEAESGHRSYAADGQGLEERKQNSQDFALWKSAKPGEPAWESPWGSGRPGWHTECVCMSKKYLGLPFDIHGGGSDLVFPHHENELAQAQCAWESGFANYWMHAGMLKVDNEKMSKSLGNFLMLDDILQETKPEYLRMLCLQSHYRSPLNYSIQRLEEATKALDNIITTIDNTRWQIDHATSERDNIDQNEIKEQLNATRDAFIAHMDDDFNCPAAIGEIAKLTTFINSRFNGVDLSPQDCIIAVKAIDLLIELLSALGISLESTQNIEDEDIPDEILNICRGFSDLEPETYEGAISLIIEKRQEARANKNWEVADKIRDQLSSAGYKIEDTKSGTKIVKA